MKKNTIALIITAVFMFSPFNSYAKSGYMQDHLDQFIKTGNCAGCNLADANLPSHDGANLSQALLVKADLSYGSFNGTNFTGARMMYTKFYNASVAKSNFSFSNLTGASLHAVNASGSDFSTSNLTDVDFENAILTSSNFSSATVIGADFTGANLVNVIITQSQLDSVKSLDCAIMPDGTVHSSKRGSC